LQVRHCETSDFALVDLVDCTEHDRDPCVDDASSWVFASDGKIVNAHANKCLEVFGGLLDASASPLNPGIIPTEPLGARIDVLDCESPLLVDGRGGWLHDRTTGQIESKLYPGMCIQVNGAMTDRAQDYTTWNPRVCEDFSADDGVCEDKPLIQNIPNGEFKVYGGWGNGANIDLVRTAPIAS
jgi:hypothetical protein